MNNTMYFLAFALVCFSLLWIAFGPAWQEWRHPTDLQPLPIAANYTSNIDHFSDQFRAIALARITGQPMSSHAVFEFVPDTHDQVDWSAAKRPLISFNALKSRRAIECRPPLFVNGDVVLDANNRFSGLHAQGNVQLGPNSEISEWAHADGSLYLQAGCIALRRISSAIAIALDHECCFERLHAPVVHFGPDTGQPATADEPSLIESSFSEIDGAVRRSDSLYLVQGNCKLPRGRLYRGSLIVTGRLLIGTCTQVIGDVKARAGVVVGAKARIEGALTSEKQIQLLSQASVMGPVVSETVILMGGHSRIGSPALPTTVSAENIVAEAGAVAHGTVWARDLGVVWSG
ncbi:MAG: polymer-forming cytoskeletal protein [Burkholderiales bacterium]